MARGLEAALACWFVGIERGVCLEVANSIS